MEDIVLYNIIVICLVIIVIILATYNTIQDKKHKEELKEKEEELDRRFDIWKEKHETFWKACYERKLEWYKHDQEIKKQPEYHRVTFKLDGIGNETLTIDYIKGNCELRNDGFWKIKDKDGNIILLNQKFIKEVRVYEAGNTRGSNEDDKG